jgi:hypothetical protein
MIASLGALICRPVICSDDSSITCLIITKVSLSIIYTHLSRVLKYNLILILFGKHGNNEPGNKYCGSNRR